MFQEFINAMNDNSKRISAKEYSLGDFIEDLEKLDQEKYLFVETGYGCAGLDSWRGSYCELAMEYEKGKRSKVNEVLKDAKATLGKTLTGYKGGDFLMDKDTPIHVANYGECNFEHPKWGKGMIYTDDYCPEKKDTDENFMTYASVKIIGIKKSGKNYKLKLRDDD